MKKKFVLLFLIVIQTCSFAQSDSRVNIIPKLSVNHSNHHKNKSILDDVDLSLSFDHQTTNCADPSYFIFDIMAASNPNSIFNSCVIDISYSSNEFGTWIASSVQVQNGSDFTDPSYIASVTDISSNVIEITFGDNSTLTPSGTVLTPTPITMLTVSFPIISCETSTIGFTNQTSTSSQSFYTVETADTICLQCLTYPCDDYLGFPDSTCCCIDDIEYVYQNTTYNPTDYTSDFTSISCLPNIFYNTNPIEAGTNASSVPPNSSLLTITGCGFGNDKSNGAVIVTDANLGNTLLLDTSDILHWSENQIAIKMPSIMFKEDSLTPGTGPIEVFNSCGKSTFGNLQINYNIINTRTSSEKLRPDIVMVNTSQSLNFQCDTSVTNNPQAYACVKKAIKEWNCYTGVNWRLGSKITGDTNIKDNISVIYFSKNFPASSGTTMTTYEWYNSCYNITDSIAFKDEADIKMREYLPSGYTWSYDTTSTILPANELPFYDIILHELGHAHGIGHINDPLSLMYRATIAGQRVDITTCSAYPGPASLIGALDMVNTSVANSPSPTCPFTTLVQSTVYCKDSHLSVPIISENKYNLNLYPNPVNSGDITISYHLNSISSIQSKILDYTGSVVMDIENEQKPAGTYSEQINITTFAAGVYLFIANINGECQTIKFIKL